MAEVLFQISEPGQTRTREACATRVVGIDLGTTHSLVATVRGGQPECLPDADGATLLPSVVAYTPDGRVAVGRRARDELAARFPRDTVASAKRYMGRGQREGAAIDDLTPQAFAPSGDAAVVRFSVAGGSRAVTAVEVSAEILKVLAERAEDALGGTIEGAVITVPAYFDDAQRQATRDAGRLAGLEVMRLLNEPTAAALAYGLDKQVEGTFAVFDLGGGTFDISILKLQGGVFEVKSTGGDSRLGGDDIDRAVAHFLLQHMGVPDATSSDPALVRQVLDAARATKEALSTVDSVPVALTKTDGTPWTGRVSRAELEALADPVLQRCAAPVRRALKDAGLEATDLTGVILVGGATRMPLLRARVREWFGREPLADIDPDQVVALGAAIQADLLGGASAGSDMLLLDVVPLSLGLELMGGVVEKIIHRNTTVPCGATQTFTTYADNQTGFDLHVVQGERELVADCRSLARFKLGGLPPRPAGMARMEVTFVVDADGILRVSAREVTAGVAVGKEASIDVKPTYGLAEDEVEKMLLDSVAHAEQDVQQKQLFEQRVEAARILSATENAIAASPELMTEGDRTAVAAAAARLRVVKVQDDVRAIRDAVTGLDAASKEFATRRMNRALEVGFAGQSVASVAEKLG